MLWNTVPARNYGFILGKKCFISASNYEKGVSHLIILLIILSIWGFKVLLHILRWDDGPAFKANLLSFWNHLSLLCFSEFSISHLNSPSNFMLTFLLCSVPTLIIGVTSIFRVGSLVAAALWWKKTYTIWPKQTAEHYILYQTAATKLKAHVCIGCFRLLYHCNISSMELAGPILHTILHTKRAPWSHGLAQLEWENLSDL